MMQKYFEIKGLGHHVRCKLYYSDLALAKRAVIFSTGFAGHKDNQAAEKLAGKLIPKHQDMILLVYNWPCHGDDSKKKLRLDDCGSYLDLVLQYVREHLGIEELYSCATSFGGYLVLKYISEKGDPFRKIALRCPAVCMYDVLTRSIMQEGDDERLLSGEEISVGFDRKVIVTGDLLEDLKTNDIRERNYRQHADKILILHGTADEIVPFESSRDFAEKNGIPFLPVEGADHRFLDPEKFEFAYDTMLDFYSFQEE